MKIPKTLRQALDETRLPWRIEVGGKHFKSCSPDGWFMFSANAEARAGASDGTATRRP